MWSEMARGTLLKVLRTAVARINIGSIVVIIGALHMRTWLWKLYMFWSKTVSGHGPTVVWLCCSRG